MPATLASRFADAGADAVVPQPPRDDGHAFDTTGAVTPRDYGLGSRRTVLLPMGGSAVDGGMVGGASSGPTRWDGWGGCSLASRGPSVSPSVAAQPA